MDSFSPGNPSPWQPPGGRPAPRRKSSTFNDFASGGAPVWMKILAGAVATPVIVLLSLARHDSPLDDAEVSAETVLLLVAIVAGCSLVGGLLGAALTMKDVVTQRMADGQQVAFPLNLLFGYRMWSLMLWAVVVLFATMVIALSWCMLLACNGGGVDSRQAGSLPYGGGDLH